MLSLEKRGFGDDSGDSLDDSPGSKAAHWTTQHLQAWTCMDRQESQSNWPEMRKTLGKPGFLSGEDRNRTFGCFPNVFEEFERQPSTLAYADNKLIAAPSLSEYLDFHGSERDDKSIRNKEIASIDKVLTPLAT